MPTDVLKAPLYVSSLSFWRFVFIVVVFFFWIAGKCLNNDLSRKFDYLSCDPCRRPHLVGWDKILLLLLVGVWIVLWSDFFGLGLTCEIVWLLIPYFCLICVWFASEGMICCTCLSLLYCTFEWKVILFLFSGCIVLPCRFHVIEIFEWENRGLDYLRLLDLVIYLSERIGGWHDLILQDERESLPPNSEGVVPQSAVTTTSHGIEVAVEFKPVEHPTEPLDNDRPIQCPLPEPSIINVR